MFNFFDLGASCATPCNKRAHSLHISVTKFCHSHFGKYICIYRYCFSTPFSHIQNQTKQETSLSCLKTKTVWHIQPQISVMYMLLVHATRSFSPPAVSCLILTVLKKNFEKLLIIKCKINLCDKQPFWYDSIVRSRAQSYPCHWSEQ